MLLWSAIRRAYLALGVLTFAAFPSPSGATPGDVLVLRVDAVSLYEEPSREAALIRQLTVGQRLLEFRREGDWVEVGLFQAVAVRGWLPGVAVRRELATPYPPPRKSARQQAAKGDRTVHQFTLDVGGTPALAFRGTCWVIGPHGTEERLPFAGLVPYRATAGGAAISCLVRKTDAFGRLRVMLRVDSEEVAEAQTSAPYNSLRVRSDGPWGAAVAVRGSVGLLIPRHVEPASGR